VEHLQAEVGAPETFLKQVGIFHVERLANIRFHCWSSSSSKGRNGRSFWQSGYKLRNFFVGRPEVIAPLANAMRFINHN